MPGRSFQSASAYRYGFQGQEKDDEIKGSGNSINYKYRMHDPRLGRFLSIDPLSKKYPFWSPYAFSGNRVIDARELEGLEPAYMQNGVWVPASDQFNNNPPPGAYDHLLLLGDPPSSGLELTDANDVVILSTLAVNAANGNGLKAYDVNGKEVDNWDKAFAMTGAALPFVSGSAARKLLSGLMEEALTTKIGKSIVSQFEGGFDVARKKFDELVGDAKVTNIYDNKTGDVIGQKAIVDDATVSIRTKSKTQKGATTIDINNKDTKTVKLKFTEKEQATN